MSNSILLEELNSEDLRNRVNNILLILKNEIIKIKKGEIRNTPTEKGTNNLKSSTDDFQELVQKCRRTSMKSYPKDVLELCNRVEMEWRKIIYPAIKEYNSEVDEYNKTHSPKLEKIEIRTGTFVTEEINYFPY